MANKKISELQSRTPSLSDLLLVGDPSSGYSYKCTVTDLATIIETDIADGYVTIGTTQTISGAKTFSNNLTLTSVSNANTDTDKFLVLNASNIVNFRTGAEVLSDIGGQGALTLTTTGSSGASTLVGNTLNIPTYTLSGLGGISGSGSTGYLPKFTGTTSIGNSIVQDNGSTLNIAGGIICNAISASSLTSDQYIAFQNINTSYSLSGYTMLYATLTNPGFIFNFGDGTRSAIFRYAAGSYTYTLPSATGTLALTSDITNSVSGTIGFIAKFTGTGSVGISQIYESGTSIGIGTTSPSGKTEISGSASGSTFVALNLRNIDEVVGSDASMYFSTGSGALASTNITGLIRSSVTQANPSALKGNLKFYVNSGDNIIEGMQLDTSGNLGLGVTPSAWSGVKALQIGSDVSGLSLFGYSGTGAEIGSNTWFNGTNYIYGTTAASTRYVLSGGQHRWYIAPSGTAGNAISFTQERYTQLTFDYNSSGTTKGAIWWDNNESSFNMYAATSSYLALWTNATERMRITSGGNVGIGTTGDASYKLLVKGNNASVDANGQNTIYLSAGTSVSYLATSYIGGGSYVPIAFEVGGSERMRITSGGNVLIGKSVENVDTRGIRFDSDASIYVSIPNAESTYYLRDITNAAYRFYVSGAGTIYATNTTISAISDGRLKENIRDLDIGLDAIMSLRPRKYDWKSESGNNGKNVRGFIAQEVEAIFPDLIDEWKRNPDDTITYKSLRQDFIPIIVKAIQELKAEIEILKNK